MRLVTNFVFEATFAFLMAAFLAACSASGGEETFAPQFPDEDAGTVKSSDSNGSSNSDTPESSDSAVEDSAWAALVDGPKFRPRTLPVARPPIPFRVLKSPLPK